MQTRCFLSFFFLTSILILSCLVQPKQLQALPLFYPSHHTISPYLVQNSILKSSKVLKIKKKAHKKHIKVKMTVKVIYAYTQDKSSVDPRLTRDLPSLHKMFGFNTYRLLKIHRHTISCKQALIVTLNKNYQVQLSAKKFDKINNKIKIQAVFLRRKRAINSKKARFTSYASAQFRLQNGGKVAFLGPSYEYGRILIILSSSI